MIIYSSKHMEETPLEATPSFAAPGKKKINKRFIYLVIAIFIIILVFLGFRALGARTTESINDAPAIISPAEEPQETETPTPSPSPSVSPTPTPSSTPTPKPTGNPIDSSTGLNRATLSVTVQNGSGVAGAAGKASDILKSLGYNVVSSGNADNYDYTNVTIQVKSSKSSFLNLLKKDLATSYTIGTTSANLSNGFSSDALVIIGK